ncbi:hypothetical protein [Paenibacillus sp. J2TS4]|uniref:hypothetical protein n=1 Tax=Paenibacillus sp. J2TS4 TaxID=2807194 RepID=UPI001AFE459C|nr:hypothetical protein [Paenibacillus sp. J2TS4]GIP32630.1 hypothetical protein J2TS4_18400 [Paenibacillus sp. J2TS4]
MEVSRYIGRTVEIIYLDRHNRFSQRTVVIKSAEGQRVHAYCLEQRGPRTFIIGNIMAVCPIRVGEVV